MAGLDALKTLQLDANQLTSFNALDIPNIVTLYLNSNKLATLDVSGNHSLKSLYATSNVLTSVNLGANATSKLMVSLSGNKLTTLDVTQATGLSGGKLFVQGNNLTELKYTNLGTANLSNNKFKLSTLPTANIKTLTYAPQQPMEIGDIATTIDLSSEKSVGSNNTVYSWFVEGETPTQLVKDVDYTEADGVFSFLKLPTAKVFCTMTNASLPKFADANVFKSTSANVTSTTGIALGTAAQTSTADVYTTDGKRVGTSAKWNTLKKGVYILRNGQKNVKVIK